MALTLVQWIKTTNNTSALIRVCRPLQQSTDFLNICDWEIKLNKVCLWPDALKYPSMSISITLIKNHLSRVAEVAWHAICIFWYACLCFSTEIFKILLHYRNFLDSSYPEHGKQHIRTCVKMTSHVVKKLTSLHHPKSKGNKNDIYLLLSQRNITGDCRDYILRDNFTHHWMKFIHLCIISMLWNAPIMCINGPIKPFLVCFNTTEYFFL